MGYWKDTCGESKSRDFINGVKRGVEAFAVWKDGAQYVGIMQTPMIEVWDAIEEQLGGGEDG